MEDILDKLIQKMCDCICENGECKESGCDGCMNEFAEKIVDYTTID